MQYAQAALRTLEEGRWRDATQAATLRALIDRTPSTYAAEATRLQELTVVNTTPPPDDLKQLFM